MDPIKFTDEQKKIYRAAHVPANATDDHAAYFFLECERRGLIPGVHVVMQTRQTEEYSKDLGRKVWVTKAALVTTINALRLIAERSQRFRGYGRTIFHYRKDGDTFIEKPIPIGATPHAVTTELYREGWQFPVLGIARFEACVQLKADKTPTLMWFKRGEEQLQKCAEADGLRKIAPEECGGLFIEEEMGREDSENETSAASIVVNPPIAAAAPSVNQAPAPIQPPANVVSINPPQVSVAVPEQVSSTIATPDLPVKTTAAPQESKPASVPPFKPVQRPAIPRPPANRPPNTAIAIPPSAPVSSTTVNLHGVDITDKDLPDFGGKQQAAALLAPAVSPVIPNRQALPEQEIKESAEELDEFSERVARDTMPPKFAPEDRAVTEDEYKDFVANRGAKIARDVLEKKAGLKNAGPMLKDYLLKNSGQTKLGKIGVLTFEKLISALEKATPEEAAKLVKG